MIQCSACGLQNPDDGKYCTNCGKPLELPVTAGATVVAAYCTNCGTKLPAESRFCTSCGVAVDKGADSVGSTVEKQMPALQVFLATLDERLAQSGFEKVETPALLDLERWMRRKRFELAKVGMVTTFCGVKVLNETATAAYVKDFSKSVFDFAVSNKGFLARNAFQQLLVYPVLVAPSYHADVETFLNSYWNKHWMAYEYPVVVSVSTRQAAMHRSTPLWGAAFHGSFKREAEILFAA